MKILFMGSGAFGYHILTKISQFHTIIAIYTASFDGISRKKNINQVEDFAIKNNITIHKNTSITEDVIMSIKRYDPDLIIVASYGFLLPETLLNIGKFHKPINIHPSLLPRWRGAAPIERSIENGDKKSAVCIIEMVKKMDAGDILIKQDFDIDEAIDSIELIEKTALIGCDLILKWIENPNQKPQKQTENGLTYAKKIKKEELFLNFDINIIDAYNKIRAFTGHGGCHIIYNNERIKIFKCEYMIENNTQKIGFSLEDEKIYFKSGYIKPLLLQREGRKILNAKDFFNGF